MRILMCPPDHYNVEYEINAWMRITRTPDQNLAKKQWDALYTLLSVRLGVDVELISGHAGLPDMVFTANAGIVDGGRFIPSRFRHVERQGESPYYERWFVSHGYSVQPVPDYVAGTHEGEGDSLMWRDLLLCGHGHRSDVPAHCAIGGMLGRDIVALQLVDPRWYHLDTCLLPLTDDLIAYYPAAFDPESVAAIERLPGQKIKLSDNDAAQFGANAVVVGKHIIMNSGCEELMSTLRDHGMKPHATDLSEFLKAGGAAKCLSLLLDHE